MMRNLGGAIGTAAIETFFTKREQFHSAIITPDVSLLEPATRSRLADLQQYFMSHGFPDPAGAMHRAIIAVGQTIRAQATIMGYADCFALLGVVLLIAACRSRCSKRRVRRRRTLGDWLGQLCERCRSSCKYPRPSRPVHPLARSRTTASGRFDQRLRLADAAGGAEHQHRVPVKLKDISIFRSGGRPGQAGLV
jgi:hypothetical protein